MSNKLPTNDDLPQSQLSRLKDSGLTYKNIEELQAEQVRLSLQAQLKNQPTGIKHDQEKADMSLLSPIAMLRIAEVMTFGKKKYSAHNWRGGFIWSRPAAAAIRHIFAWLGGEDKDPETGLSHLAHCACCLMFLLEFETTKPELDDRFKNENK